MEWREEGVLLSAQKHGETSVIIQVFCKEHGRHAGVVRGGASRKIAPILQPGAQLDLAWRARLEEHIGTFKVEPVKSRAAGIMDDPTALAALNAITALLAFTLPERAAHPVLFHHSVAMLDLLGTNDAWPVAYLKWELALLEEMGFGLDLETCAVTGTRDDLTYVSPKSGRAVSAEAAGEWADKLLPLPPELLGVGTGAANNVADGLLTTGFFLEHRLAHSLGDRPLPGARARLVDRLHHWNLAAD